jgi:hypothetical protein
MEHPTNPPDPTRGPGRADIAVSDWIRRRRPDLHVLVNADPDPALRSHNLVAFTDDPDRARTVALEFERVRTDLSEVGTVALGHADRSTRPAVDPENVAAHAARTALRGALVGALLGALVIGLGSWALVGGGAALVGGVVGGALFGAGVAAVWSYVIGTGQSPAYRESFVDPDLVEVVAVSVHADDAACIDAACEAVADVDGVELLRIDQSGAVAT